MNFTLKQLQAFVAIANHGSTVAAARSLKVSQPAVSSALTELETHLGSNLFDRWKKTLLLNERGRSLLPMARLLLANAHELDNAFRGEDGQLGGVLRLGASSTLSSYVLPDILDAFLTAFPSVRVEVISRNKTDIIAKVEDCDIDIGVVAGVCHRSYVTAIPWRTDELCVFAAAAHPLAAKKTVSVADLAASRWAMREEGSGTREVFLGALPPEAKPLKVIMDCNNIESIKRVVEHGHALGCVAHNAIRLEVEAGILAVLQTPHLDLRRNYSILVHQHRRQSPLLNAFVTCCTTAGAHGGAAATG